MIRPVLQVTAAVGALALVPVTTGAMASVETSSYRELDAFMDVYARVKADYVEQVDDKTLIKGAIDGMLASLDPHSSFADGIDYDNLQIQTSGSYGGLGLSVTMEDGAVKVITPTEDTPAWRAGIKSGDFITHLDGKLIYGGTLDEAVTQMRGEPGSKIVVRIVRPGRDKPFDVTLTREIIVQKAVKWEVKDGIGILNINTFSATTAADMRAGIAAIEKQLGGKPKGYVIDLRANGGGLLNQAIEVTDAFLQHGEIVSQRGRDKADIERWYAKADDLARGLPLVVLVDAGTASASEIVAGALQDHHRALVMGERTFGKGSVQSILNMGPRTALRLTTARYYTPSGHSVQEGGITPDIAVPQLSDPDYKTRPVLREADLRRHLLNQDKVDNSVLEEDTKPDPRFAASVDDLKKKGVEDFQLHYALETIARTAPPARMAGGGAPKAGTRR
ncbi:S41 family peptidase [Sphingomonas sp.]|uniref:S41 family peptidase n=1 Tax=Sphingomonas sp. TaxID=28214 RepID=UPI002EDA853D